MNHKEFIKLTKKQKLALPTVDEFTLTKVNTALFIPVHHKNDGYSMSACFLKVADNWVRVPDYDCFRFINSNRKIKGDFENGGVQFFGLDSAIWTFGNEFDLNKQL